MRTTRGKILIWVLGSVGTVLAGIATLAANHVLTWFDPPDTTAVVLAQNDALVRSLTQTLDRLTAQQTAVPPAAVSAPIVPPASSSPLQTWTALDPVTDSASIPNLSQLLQTDDVIADESASSSVPQEPMAVPSSAKFQPASEPILVADLPETPTVPAAEGSDISRAAAAPLQVTPAAVAPVSFGVFENQAFSMCGHTGFTVSISGKALVLASNDRSIPGRTFRGYEKTLQPGRASELWPGCSVAAGYTTAAGVVRIAISVIGGR